MNKYVLTILLLLSALFLYAAPDDIIGVWREDKGTGKTQFYKVGTNKYKAKCCWLKDSNGKKGNQRLDTKNPDKSKRSQTIVGSHVMDVTYNPDDNSYNMDWAYDPSWGVALDNCGTIKISGTTMTVSAGWAFIRVNKKMYKE